MKYEQALQQSISYFNGDELAANVFLGKYALHDGDGELLEATPEDMHHRIAGEFARVEQKYPNPLSEDEIFGYLDRFKYIIPQGSPMAGIGNPYQIMSLSNCFVVDGPYDSYSGILMTDQEQAQLMKRRGGVGFDISRLRPKGMPTNNAAKTTDGIAVFMERFSNTTREVAQGGRRGALMLTISVHHPEIETFIKIKNDMTKVTGANISIRLSDVFMNAVKENKKYQLQWPVDSDNPVIVEHADATEIWDKIITSAHASAEPGLLFWDTVKRRSATDDYPDFQTVSTNPCGEITLSAYDSCRLLLINTLSFVIDPFAPEAEFDWDKFYSVCKKAQRLMDDMVDLELEQIDKILAKIDVDPEPENVKRIERELWKKIRWSCENGRRTGLGVTAIGDTIAALGRTYGSDESIKLISGIYSSLTTAAYEESMFMADQRGAFPVWDYEKEKNNEFIHQIFSNMPSGYWDTYTRVGRRNIACTTTAPAGSVSVLSQTTSGIEPAFMTSYTRRKKINPNDKEARIDFVDDLGDKWQEFIVYHHGFKQWMDVTGKTDVVESPYHQATANDIDWTAKVRAQAAAQRWIDHAISNTTNIPEDTPIEVVKDIYMTGWESGCKGVTVYREGSRSGVLINKQDPALEIPTNNAPKRPLELECDVHHMQVLGEKWLMFIGLLNGKPYELMGGLSKYVSVPKRVKTGKIVKHNSHVTVTAKYDFHYDFDENSEDETIIKDINNAFENTTEAAFTRTISLALRHGAPVRYVVEQIQKGADKESEMFSFSKAASRVLKHYIANGLEVKGVCYECGSENLIYEEGCAKCTACGSSKCG